MLWALAKLGHRAGQGAVTHDLLATLLERFFYHDEHAAPASLRHISAIIWACANLKSVLGRAALRCAVGRGVPGPCASLSPEHAGDGGLRPAAYTQPACLPPPLSSIQPPARYPIEPAQLSRLIRRAEAALERAGAQAQLSTVDANMMLTAFEALESAEGLQFLKRCGRAWVGLLGVAVLGCQRSRRPAAHSRLLLRSYRLSGHAGCLADRCRRCRGCPPRAAGS